MVTAKPNITPTGLATLEGVPDDIHHLIFSEQIHESPATMLALAQSSKALRQAALPYVYRDLVLAKRPSDQKRPTSDAFLEILREDKDCQIAKQVHSITVKDEIPETTLASILNKISECGALRKLSWETPIHMPPSILDMIQTTLPKLELSVRLFDRWEAPGNNRQMDTKLLSSPLLTKLDYSIYSQGNIPDQPTLSEWPKLIQSLAFGGNIRALHVHRVHDYPPWKAKNRTRILSADDPENLTLLDLPPDTRLPKLEELALIEMSSWGSTKDCWDTEHMNLLQNAINRSHLRSLNLGEYSPGAFFSSFNGLLPNLKELRFALKQDALNDTKKFIESTTALEALDIYHSDVNLTALWPAIRKHKSTLKQLVLRPTLSSYTHQPQYPDPHYLNELSRDFPSLERLGWIVHCQQSIDAESLTNLSSLNLKKLDLFFYIPHMASDFSDKLRQNAMGTIPPPPFSMDRAKVAAIKIMDMITQNQKRPLEWLTLHIARIGYEDRMQPYNMAGVMQFRRLKDRTKDKDQYEVRGSGNWGRPIEMQLELEEE